MKPNLLARERIVERLREMEPLLREKGVCRVDLFGSVAEDCANADSDVDLLVELDRPMGFSFFTLQDYIAARLGVRVEISTRHGLRPRDLAEAEKSLVPIY